MTFQLGDSVRLKTPYCPNGQPLTRGTISEVVCESEHFNMYSVTLFGYSNPFVDFRGEELELEPEFKFAGMEPRHIKYKTPLYHPSVVA